MTLTLTLAIDPNLHRDPHDPQPEEDLLSEDRRPQPDCSLFPIRPTYYRCRRSLMQCVASNICHDICHLDIREDCFHKFGRCMARRSSAGTPERNANTRAGAGAGGGAGSARRRQSTSRAERESVCSQEEEQCYTRNMTSCERECAPCRRIFATCRLCVTRYPN